MSREPIDIEDLRARLVACKGFRWVSGMAYLRRGRSHRVDPDVLSAGGSYDDTCQPDLADPATLGCLLALVREAWGDSRLVAIFCEAANPGQSEGWAVQTADNRLPVAGDDYPSEAEALVAALEAAP